MKAALENPFAAAGADQPLPKPEGQQPLRAGGAAPVSEFVDERIEIDRRRLDHPHQHLESAQ